MTHNHDAEGLHHGCDYCLEIVRRDQYQAEVAVMTDQALEEALMARDHIQNDWQRDLLDRETHRRAAQAAHPSNQEETS